MPLLNPDAPKPGTLAPPLTVDHLLQAPAGTKLDWSALHGKVIVLEFWATWCVPCVAEIPVLNSLAASVDPAKVQFISVDDEDPKVVEAFLQKHPIQGWIALTSTKTFLQYGIDGRPATIIIGPDGRVATADAHPEFLTTNQLLALADGKPVNFNAPSGPASAAPAALAERSRILDAKFRASIAPIDPNAAPVITVSPGEPGDGHAMMLSANQFDFTNFPLGQMLKLGTGIRPTRVTINGTLPDKPYNLHVAAPTLTPTQLTEAVTKAISAATGLKFETNSAMTDCYILQAEDGASQHATPWDYPGIVNYDKKTGKLMAIHGTLDQLAAALEKALGTPVIDETNLTGKLNLTANLPPSDLHATNELLAKELNLKLVPAKRPITTYTVSASTTPAP